MTVRSGVRRGMTCWATEKVVGRGRERVCNQWEERDTALLRLERVESFRLNASG